MGTKNTSIIAAGKKFDVGCRVITWDEEEGLSFYPKKHFYARNWSFKELQQKMKCFVVHHSVTYTAHSMFRGLNARGLSVNFMIDDDINEDGIATIYQCADIKEGCWSHYPLNEEGPGVEISYHPEYWDNPNLYSAYYQAKFGVQPHDVVTDVIRGRKFKVFAPTEAQVKACIRLLWGFHELFPNVRPEFPKDENGNVSKVTRKEIQDGFLAHFHVSNVKVDPMGFPFERVEKEVEQLHKEYQNKQSNKPTITFVSGIWDKISSLMKLRG